MKTMTSIKATLLAILILISLAAAAFAQETSQGEPTTIKGAVIKGKAPVNRTVLKVKLPKAQEATLKNGLRIVVLERNKIPTFSMELVVLSGGLSDSADKRGLAGVTAAILREGTAKHNSREIAELLDTLGATVGANSGLNSFTTNVSAAGLVENFDQVLGLFSEVIRTPSFPADELDKYKSRTTFLLQGARSQATFLAQERLAQAIYGDHPAATVSQPVETLKKLTADDLKRFHAANYLPNNSILFLVGDVRLKEVLPKIQSAFGDWKSGTAPQLVIKEVPLQSASRIQLINRPGSVQTVFQIGALGITRTDPDYAGFAVMNRILGGGASSRLFLNIREDKGYAYSVGSSFNTSKYRGTFVASSPVRTEVTEGTLREFMNEFKRIREEKVSPAELDNAKRAIVGQFALALENPQSLLQNIITQKLYNLPADYWDTYPQRVEAITAEDVQRIAQAYIDLPHLQIIAVGDAAKTRDVLAKFGHLDVYDTDGKLVAAAGVKP
jgi:predicted Zn-dependent peptidase